MEATSERVTQGDAIAAIAAEGASPAELGLIVDLFESNARHLELGFQSLYESEKAAHERTKEQLGEALAQIRKARYRAAWLCGDADLFDPTWMDEA